MNQPTAAFALAGLSFGCSTMYMMWCGRSGMALGDLPLHPMSVHRFIASLRHSVVDVNAGITPKMHRKGAGWLSGKARTVGFFYIILPRWPFCLQVTRLLAGNIKHQIVRQGSV